MENFYGNFLASVEPINVPDFKDFLGQFIHDDFPQFQNFIEANTKITMKKISLSQKSKHKFEPFHLSHLKSKRASKNVMNWLSENFFKTPFEKLPDSFMNDNMDLRSYFFNSKII